MSKGRTILAAIGLIALGAISAALLGYLLAARNKPELSSWHRVDLGLEARSGESAQWTLDDYLANEEALFERRSSRDYAPDPLTLAEVFAANGYRTVTVSTNMNLYQGFNLDQGFETYDAVATSEESRWETGINQRKANGSATQNTPKLVNNPSVLPSVV